MWRCRPVRSCSICRHLVGFLEHGVGPTATLTYNRNIEMQTHSLVQCAIGHVDPGIRGAAVMARTEYFNYIGS